MFTFAFKFTTFLYIPNRFMESIATFGYVKQFFRLLQRAFVCLKIHFEQMLQLHIFFFIDHCSFAINLELGESVKVVVELLIDVI